VISGPKEPHRGLWGRGLWGGACGGGDEDREDDARSSCYEDS